MQLLADAMTDKSAHDGEAGLLRRFLNHGTQIPEPFSLAELLDAVVQGFSGHLHQSLCLIADLANANGDRRIAVKSVIDDAVIESHDIPLAKGPARRDAVDDLFVDRYTETAWKNP